ncbi:hypothetical protein [Pseudohongiella nitratireducens]|jgi:hypothetical protein|nr:hypothetical protein [Pseudohongiella nitratireducens]
MLHIVKMIEHRRQGHATHPATILLLSGSALLLGIGCMVLASQ